MSGALYGLAGACVRHRFRATAIWLVLVGVIIVVSNSVGRETSNDLTLPGTGSTQSQDLLQDNLPKQANGTNPVVMETPSGTLTTGKNEQAVKATVSSLKKAPHVISAVSPLSSEGAGALSKDKRIGYISVTIDLSSSDLTEDQANEIIDAEAPAREAGFKVATGGYLGQAVSKPSTESSEAVGIAAAVIILLFTFGTVTAMALPIATAIVGLGVGLSAIGLLGHGIEVPTVGPTLGTMLGLGVGIDYALFIVTRHRGFIEEGHPPEEAAARAVATAGGAVVFAGGTVVIALCSLAVARIPIVSALGYSAAIVVLIAVITAITLLPALLAILGPRINALRVPFLRPPAHDHRPHGWARWARGVGQRATGAMVLGVAILLVLAIPVLDLEFGQQDNGQLSKSTTTRQAYDLLTKGFGPGVNGPLLIAVDFDGSPAHPDNKQLKQVQHQQQQAQQQAVDRSGAAARSRGCAPGRGAVGGGAAGEVAAADQEGEAGRPAGGLPEDVGQRPAAGQAREQDRQDQGRQGRLAGGGRQVGPHGRVHRDADHGAVGRRHRGPGPPVAGPRDPGRAQGNHPRGLRRRPDGRLHRPRRPDQRAAAAGDRHGDRAQLPPAPDRLPLDRRARSPRA